jgi:hypothetical protein
MRRRGTRKGFFMWTERDTGAVWVGEEGRS